MEHKGREKIQEILGKITKKHIITAVSGLAVMLIAAITGMLYWNQLQLERKLAEQTKEALSQEIVIEVPKEEAKEPEVEEVVALDKLISFSGTSIEKDLKIKIVDESSKLVEGTAFEASVYKGDDRDKGKTYIDEDMDGIIYIQNMEGGAYQVELGAVEGFVIAENPISVVVKEKIEYVKVDVSAEVKTEEEVDTKVEDTANNNVQEEKPIVNTLPYLESKVIVTKVKKENVSTEHFPVAILSEAQTETSIGENTLCIPSEITLYNQGNDASKSILVRLNVSGNGEINIQNTEWTVEAAGVAGCTKNNEWEAVVSAKQGGTTNVTVTINYMGIDTATQTETTMSTTLKATIKVEDVSSDTTQLLSQSGSPLYLDTEGKVAAVLKDYAEKELFYEAPKYTGWQTIEGETYYFDANYQAVTGEQTIGYFQYAFDSQGRLVDTLETKGIDVSKWQAEIDWEAVAGAGIDFAIIRVGYRGSSAGVLVEDPYFKANIDGATKAGIKVGVYFFTQAITEAEAVEEASMALELVKGYHLDYPIFIDTEWSGGRADNLSKSLRTKIIKAFCKTIQNAGYKAGIYASKSWYMDKLNADELNAYTIWVAQYNTECNYTGKYDMWQYTDKGSIPGISGNVDLNICYKGL